MVRLKRITITFVFFLYGSKLRRIDFQMAQLWSGDENSDVLAGHVTSEIAAHLEIIPILQQAQYFELFFHKKWFCLLQTGFKFDLGANYAAMAGVLFLPKILH